MDIFTTALTRVVPVPIKPTNLKVKALQKSAGASAVSDDIGDVEEHELYFKKPITGKPSEQKETSDNASTEVVEASPDPADHTGQNVDVFEDSEISPEKEDDNKPHLDIFI
tara:strand:+ start:562 stop:894 length:333 start_codon:yes stop_codon:yes gene_type:complete